GALRPGILAFRRWRSSCGDRRTLVAAPEQEELVPLEAEAPRQQLAEGVRAALDVVHLPTVQAAEVVVVVLAGHLVPRRLTGQVYLSQEAVIEQLLDGPVDGGDAQPRHLLARRLEDLRR